MIRKLLKDSAVYTIATILTKGVQVFLLPILTRLLNPAEYGINDIVSIFLLYALSLFSIEINQAIARFYPAEKSADRKSLISSTGLYFLMVSFTCFLALTMPFADTLAKWLLGSAAHDTLVRIALIAMVSNGIFGYLQAQLRWDLRSFDYSLSSLTFVVVSTVVSIISIAVFKVGGSGVFIGQIAGSVVAGTISYSRNRSAYKLQFSATQLKAMLRFSFPLLIAAWLALTSLYIDRFFIQANLSVDSVGVYGIAAKFSSMVSILFVGFNMAITPLIYSDADSQTLPAEIARTFSIFLPLAGLLACFTYLFSREILMLLTSAAYHSGRRVMPTLVLSSILSNLYLFTPGLSITKNTRPLVLISFVAMVMSIGLNALLVPKLGIAGSALASVTTSGVAFLMNYWFSQRAYYIPFRFKSIVTIGVLIVLSGFSGMALDFSKLPYLMSLLIKVLAMAGIGIFIAILHPEVIKTGKSAYSAFLMRVKSGV